MTRAVQNKQIKMTFKAEIQLQQQRRLERNQALRRSGRRRPNGLISATGLPSVPELAFCYIQELGFLFANKLLCYEYAL
jgi:hypothetical protein